MSCISQAPSLATTLTSNPSQVVISTPHGPVPNSPATTASRSWTPLTFPLATSPAGKATVATTGVMVVASSMHAPDAEFYQLALAESVDPSTHTLSLPLTPPPSQKGGSIHHHHQQPQQPAHPQPALAQQCAAPPSPPSSTSDLEEEASVLHISAHHAHVRAPPQQRKVLVSNRDAPLPPMRRTAKPRFRRKPLPRTQAPGPQPQRALTPPPSLPLPPKQAGLLKGKNPQWRRAAVINDDYFQRWQANGLVSRHCASGKTVLLPFSCGNYRSKLTRSVPHCARRYMPNSGGRQQVLQNGTSETSRTVELPRPPARAVCAKGSNELAHPAIVAARLRGLSTRSRLCTCVTKLTEALLPGYACRSHAVW